MVLIKAILPPSDLGSVRDILKKKGLSKYTVSHALGFGEGPEAEEKFQALSGDSAALKKVVIEFAVADELKPDIISGLQSVAGSSDSGSIFVTKLDDADAP